MKRFAKAYILFFIALVLPLAGTAAGQVQVSSANPNAAEQGTLNLNVTISGKGFKNGAQAKWFVTGSTNPGGVQVNSTTWVNSTTLTANITVSDAAVISTFDIQVQNSDGRIGKGTELFAVTVKGTGGSCSVNEPIVTSSVVSQDASCISALTGAGSLDSCFGTNGKVTTNINLGSTWAKSVAVQADGKSVVGARADNNPPGTGSGFYVLRYDAQGALDSTFGGGGVVRTAFGDYCDDSAYPKAIAVQPDGKIIVAGSAHLKQGSNIGGFAVARLFPDGSKDTSFGANGTVIFNFSTGQGSAANALVLQSNGYIVVAGASNNGFAIARLTPSGALDIGFNGTGKVTISTVAKNNADTLVGGAYGVALQKILVNGTVQEKLVVVGIRPSLPGLKRDFAVVRLDPNGALDPTFGAGGKVFTDFAGLTDQAYDVAIDADNKIVVAGHTITSNSSDFPTMHDSARFALVRYTVSGQLDSSFGIGGKVTAGVPGYSNISHGVAIQSDGKIVIAGDIESADFNYADFAIERFTADGNPDSSFGGDGTGIVITDFSGQTDYSTGGFAIQPDGKIVVAGWADGDYRIGLARYLP